MQWLWLFLGGLIIPVVRAAPREISLDVNSTSEIALIRSSSWGELPPRTRAPNASISFSFLGSGLNVKLFTYQTFGLVEIDLDGQKTQIDAFLEVGESMSSTCALCLSSLDFGQHTVTVTNVGPSDGTTGSRRSWLYIKQLSYITDDGSPESPTSSPTAPTDTSPSSSSPPPSSPPTNSTSTTSGDIPSPTHPHSTTRGSSAGTVSSSSSPSVGETNTEVTSSTQLPPLASNPPSSSSSTGVITGAVIGCITAVAIIATGVWFLMRRRRRPAPTAPSDASFVIDIPSVYLPAPEEPKFFELPFFSRMEASTAAPVPEKPRRVLVLQNAVSSSSLDPEVASTMSARSPPDSSVRSESTTASVLREDVRHLRERLEMLTRIARHDKR